jgi:hypothetical protein
MSMISASRILQAQKQFCSSSIVQPSLGKLALCARRLDVCHALRMHASTDWERHAKYNAYAHRKSHHDGHRVRSSVCSAFPRIARERRHADQGSPVPHSNTGQACWHYVSIDNLAILTVRYPRSAFPVPMKSCSRDYLGELDLRYST